MKGSVKSEYSRKRNQLSAPAETEPEMYLRDDILTWKQDHGDRAEAKAAKDRTLVCR